MARWSDSPRAVCLREAAGKEASPTAAIIDSQSVKGAEKGGARIDLSGYDVGKAVKGKKRHIVVDTLGMILAAHIQPADIQDCGGALPVLNEIHRLFQRVFADGGYHGTATAAAVRQLGTWHLEVVKRSDTAKGFQV